MQNDKSAQTTKNKAETKSFSANNGKSLRSSELNNTPLIQKKETNSFSNNSKPFKHSPSNNKNGIPEPLKSGIENLSKIDISDVKVHRNSSQPAYVQAQAFTQGSNIYLAPGQDKHLAHEAWHSVQQKQGRVKTTEEINGVKSNNDRALETEADLMGQKALQFKSQTTRTSQLKTNEQLTKHSIATNPIIQRRALNPFEHKGEHKGYELTAHHIVPHSKLELAIKLLKNYDAAINSQNSEKSELATSVLKNSIPNELTEENLINIGLFSKDQKAHIEASWLTKIQAILDGTDTVSGESELISSTEGSVKLRLTPNSINGSNLNDLRRSFYEWQGGNQFMGPNTDFREEPGSKDEIDFDAQWITNMSAENFEKLTGLKQSKHKKIATPDTSKTLDVEKNKEEGKGLGLLLIDILKGKAENNTPSLDDATKIKDILNEILKVTKDVKPEVFAESKWKEVDDINEFEKLESNQTLEGSESRTWGREGSGVTEHAFFAFETSELNSLPEIANSSGGSSKAAYAYSGTDIPGSKVKSGKKGSFIYLPIKESKNIYATPVIEEKTALDVLFEIGVISDKSSNSIQIDDSSDKLTFIAAGKGGNRKFNIKGYSDANIFVGNKTGTLNIPNKMLAGKKVTLKSSAPVGDSLYEYCKKKTEIKVSTYMPQDLYDWLKA